MDDASAVQLPTWPLPDGMMVIDRGELMDLLRVVIARGQRLKMDDDADYTEWLQSLEDDDGMD